jgi:hypothetical protein
MINGKKFKVSKKLIVGGILVLLFLITSGVVGATIAINKWFEHNRLVFKQPVEVKFNRVVTIEERKPEVIVEKFVLDYPDPIDTPLKKYICDKWGVFDCKTALAVFTAESGLREDALHINENNTIDFGIAQINSIHYKKPGCSLKEITDQYKNVDCAYTIWEKSGWGAWVGFNNGNFKTHL